MSFVEALQSPLRKYADFSGRAPRKEFWSFFLVVVIAVYGLAFLSLYEPALGVLVLVAWLALIVPYWAVAVRRLHDTGRSGWWMFASVIPVAGPFIILYCLASDSERGDNRYGPHPYHPGDAPVPEPARVPVGWGASK